MSTNSWDIYARPYSSAGVGGAILLVNSYVYGDQYVPKISSIGADYLIVWTSLGQDGSREGVFGQFVTTERFIGRRRISREHHHASASKSSLSVASDGASQFLAVWTSFTASPTV